MHRLVPHFILENYQAKSYHGSFKAVGLLVDVTGFSTMTDVLATHGMHGSEVLANGMRQVFDPMIYSVHAYGGFVVGFAGDAITALFPVEGSDIDSYAKALAAALRIQEYRAKNSKFETPYGDFDISVKIGIGVGDARWRIVSATDGNRATYYFRGSAIDQAVSSLGRSNSGQIVICPMLHKALNEDVRGQLTDEHLLLTDFAGTLPAADDIRIPPPNPDHLRVFCSEDVSAHDLSGEFRPAVNLFIGIPPEVERKIDLEQFIQKVFSLQDRFGGLFSRVDIGDKGTNLLMFWGAPRAQENDVERALNLFSNLLKDTGVPIKAGITYRQAYAGYMGGELQEEYTCYGWGVNLSARLMTTAAPGEIWADEEIARRAERHFNFQHVGQQKLKGFAKEQNVFKLLTRREDDQAVFSGTFVGRESELETLSKFIAPIWSGGFAGMLTIFGEPGIGKSRLVHAFQTSEIFTNKQVYWALCQTDEIVRQSLNPFRYWLKRYFNISETMDDSARKQIFSEKIDEVIAYTTDEELSQGLDKKRSFLGELVDLHWTDSLYEKLDAQGRYENTTIVLSTLLRAESLKRPVILLIEDAHLLDNDSKEFLQILDRTLAAEREKSYPLGIIATSRHEGTKVTLEYAPCDELNLTQLSADDLVPLSETLLSGAAAPSLIEILEQRTEGNPFYLEQIIRFLQEDDNLEQGPKGWQIKGKQIIESLPTDINAILVSRLDRLNRDVRNIVQTASVLGREFELRLLSKMLHDEESLPEKVHHAVEAEILSALAEIRYIFRHALLRDTAYNMQLRARQQELHKIAVDAFEILYQDQLAPHYGEIAYHADQAGLGEKAKKFYILAGEEAARAYQNDQAIESYTHALAFSTLEDIQERFELLLARAYLYRTIGDQNGQEQDLATLELLAERQQSVRNHAIVAVYQAVFAFEVGELREAQLLSQNAIEMAQSVQALDVAAHAYRTLPLALARQGRIKEAIETAQIGLQLTQQVGDRHSEGQTLNELGLIMLEQREPARARAYFERSLTIAQEIGNLRLEAQISNNMGNISAIFENDYAKARSYYEKSLEIIQEIGNRFGESFAFGNLGWMAAMQGDFEQAQLYQEKSLTIARETGNLYQEASGLINLSAMLITQEKFSEALTHVIQSLDMSQKIGDRSTEAWSLTYLGHANLGLGNLQEATNSYQKALDIRYELEQRSLAMEPLAGLAQVELEKGELATAQEYVERILSHLSTGGNLEGTEEPLRVYLTVYKVLISNEDSRANPILIEGHSLLMEQVNGIQDQAIKQMYVQNFPWRRAIEELWEQHTSTKKQDD